VIYDAEDRPVRLVGFTWTGTEIGGRDDQEKAADACGVTWRVPADPIGNQYGNYDSMYADIRASGYNVLRVPVSWNNLEPVAPVWDETSNSYTHTWNPVYVTGLKSMVRKARAAGLLVILDMHQDLWSPALHNITTLKGKKPRCEGAGMPRWLYPTLDVKKDTTEKDDVRDAANWFFRNVHDPLCTVTRADPWQLLYAAWDQLAYQFSAQSGFPDYGAVVGADLFNEPYIEYVGGSPADGQSVLEASGTRLQALYSALAPAITARNPGWLLFFQDSTGGYDAANPTDRETPTMTEKPSKPGNWVYSVHLSNALHGTFADGVPRHDDFGVTLADKALANARAWGVPLFIGEFTTFTRKTDVTKLTESDMEQTAKFLSWATAHRVGWAFWAYVSPDASMSLIDFRTNRPIPVVKSALDAGLDAPASNQPPVASFTSMCVGLACSFDAGPSTDPDGSAFSYHWAFGDRSTGSGSAPSHVFARARTYGVTLTVTDDRGAAATTTAAVTPSRGSALYASDSFTRIASDGWGIADTGGSWSTGGSPGFAVSGNVGTMTLARPGLGRSILLGDVSSTTTDVQVTATADKVATGGGTYVSVVGRRVPGSGDYRAKVRLLPTGEVGLSMVRTSAKGKETDVTGESVVAGLAVPHLAGVRIRFQAVGTQPTTVRAKVWLASGREPDAWAATATDSTEPLQEPGAVGLMGYLSRSATNAPTVVRFDDFQAGPTTQ
jgi:aryl-phospho-beta-D-glucosidase BglC (GH1 family)